MTVKYSPGSSGASAMIRAILVLMLLLGAVVAAHGRPVACVNKCPKPIQCNGIVVAVNATVIVDIDLTVKIDATDITGALVSGTFSVPRYATEFLVIYVNGYLKVILPGKIPPNTMPVPPAV
ncbi:hypothetical protein M758_3G052500 [Ceratodon purpureus]|uniref:Uncharacterized protein n=1 Tax=Ceratodon purpureus TaxID=3225 RepID=A0A8T0IHS8_CERPU|nr:hypothetical protein KC19_3G054500 [Ceratodon purpureus]KAG0621840.1 hypothetical protein M758_3G052500 [Ceratodon purpureus]